MLVLEGPAGVGKTRLIDAIAERADGFDVLRGRASRPERESAFGVARDLLENRVLAHASWPDGDPGEIIRMLVRATLVRAARTPVLVALDDLQWSDEASLRFALALARRVNDAPAVVLLAWRPAEPGASSAEVMLAGAGERADLSPLELAEIEILLEQAGPGLQALAGAVLAASEGRPAFVVALCRSLAGEGRGVAPVCELAPDALIRAVSRQLLEHGASAVALAHAIAVLGPEVRLATAAGLAGLSVTSAAALADELAAAGLLSPAIPLAFAAPVLRSVVYAAMPSAQRAMAHRAAVDTLRSAGASDETLAEHLLRTEPKGDSRDAELLRRCAHEARGTGDCSRAMALLRRALKEAPAAAQRGAIALELGMLEAHLRADTAEHHLRVALRDGTPAQRATAELALADAELLERRGDDARTLLDRDRAVERLSGARAGEALLCAGAPGAAGAAVSLLALQAAEEPAAGVPLIEREIAVGLRRDTPVAEAAALMLRARAHLVRGSLAPVQTDAERALALCRSHALNAFEPFALAALVESLLDQGRIADAAGVLAGPEAGDGAAGDFGGTLLAIAAGRLRASAGNAHLGLRLLLGAGARLLRAGWLTPAIDWRSRAGLLAHRLGRRDEATRLIDDELELAQRLGASRPIAVALRARALVATAAQQITMLTDAVEILRETPARLERARALCDLGAALRRWGERSRGREPLQEALQLAHECGAVALEQRARRELLVLGARPRRHAVTGVAALTVREREASELAAAGLTNREIAEAMTVTANTVEYHLTNVYRKLGVCTREHLAAHLDGV